MTMLGAWFLVLVVSVCAGIHLPTLDDQIVLKPTVKGKPALGIVLVQGAYIKNSDYVPLARAIQTTLTDYSTTIVLPQFIDSLPEPVQMGSVMDKALKVLSGSPVVVGAHSLGGVVLQDWSKDPKNVKKVKGQFLIGSYITRDNRKPGPPPNGYPMRSLTLTGEVDGLARITRIAEGFHEQLDLFPTHGVYQWPVVVLEGLSHWSASSGTDIPKRVREYDLKPEVSMAQGHKMLAQVISNWVGALLQGDTSSGMNAIKAAVAATDKNLIRPIIVAMDMEGSEKFKKPCRCDPTICPSLPDCINGSRWTAEISQPTMSGVAKYGTKVEVRDSFHICSTILPKPPYVHEPKIVSNWTCAEKHINECPATNCTDPKSCTLRIATITRNVYGKDPLDGGLVPVSALEMRTKMTSRQWAFKISGVNRHAKMNVTDPLTRCAEINDKSIQYGYKFAPKRTVDRFKKLGVPYVTAMDIKADSGPNWIWQDLHYNEIKGPNGRMEMQLRSPSLQTHVNCTVPIFGPLIRGTHYCKVLSPARALEWLYVDGLRHYDGINSTVF